MCLLLCCWWWSSSNFCRWCRFSLLLDVIFRFVMSLRCLLCGIIIILSCILGWGWCFISLVICVGLCLSLGSLCSLFCSVMKGFIILVLLLFVRVVILMFCGCMVKCWCWCNWFYLLFGRCCCGYWWLSRVGLRIMWFWL